MATTETGRDTKTDQPTARGLVRFSLFGNAFQGSGRARIGRLMGVVWIVFLMYPIIDLFQRSFPWPERILLLIGLAVFTGLWLSIAIFRNGRDLNASFSRIQWGGISVLYVLAVVLTVASGMAWQGLFYYFESTVGWLRPRIAVRIVALAATTVLVLGIIYHQSILGLSANILQTILIGILIMSMFQLVRTNAELRAAREELARLAVAEERLRFARDLHDLLGHSLSLITLKSELAGRLTTVAPERAASEIRDIEQVAREALREVREAVAGYRQPTLDAELAGARTLLTAAGIACTIEPMPDDLPTNVDALFAWTAREGVTNVIRHSNARRCTVALRRNGETATITITDDGRGSDGHDPDAPRRIGGSGLPGLAERVAAAGGQMEAGPLPGGGFRLSVTAPLRVQDESPSDPGTESLEATA